MHACLQIMTKDTRKGWVWPEAPKQPKIAEETANKTTDKSDETANKMNEAASSGTKTEAAVVP